MALAKQEDNERSQADTRSDGVTATLGSNLRRLRVRRGLSLERLAEVSGVSRSMLSQIELKHSTPTIKTLWRIAGALDVPFAALLEDGARSGTKFLSRSESKTLTSQDGSFSSRALFPFDGERKVEFYELSLAPRSAENAVPHAPGTIENLVVSSGKLDVVVGTERYQLNTGDAIIFEADVAHRYSNPGYVPTLMYLVMTYAKEIG